MADAETGSAAPNREATNDGTGLGPGEPVPRDAKVVMSILKSMGVEQFEPRVVNQFLEFMYRYITDVLGDARVYSGHAGRTNLDVDDVQLAIQSRVNFSFTQPPPREVLLEMAKARNSVPLPPLDLKPGIALPPEAETLIHPNWQILLPSQTRTDPSKKENVESRANRKRPRPDEEDGVDWETEAEEGRIDPGVKPELGEEGGKDGRKVSFSLASKQPKT